MPTPRLNAAVRNGRLHVQMDMAFEAVFTEALRAIAKHGEAQTPANPGMPDTEKLVILVEEIGEVARALTYDEGSRDQLYAELIQVATMALMWSTTVR